VFTFIICLHFVGFAHRENTHSLANVKMTSVHRMKIFNAFGKIFYFAFIFLFFCCNETMNDVDVFFPCLFFRCCSSFKEIGFSLSKEGGFLLPCCYCCCCGGTIYYPSEANLVCCLFWSPFQDCHVWYVCICGTRWCNKSTHGNGMMIYASPKSMALCIGSLDFSWHLLVCATMELESTQMVATMQDQMHKAWMQQMEKTFVDYML
jgi:hypothetical protein